MKPIINYRLSLIVFILHIFNADGAPLDALLGSNNTDNQLAKFLRLPDTPGKTLYTTDEHPAKFSCAVIRAMELSVRCNDQVMDAKITPFKHNDYQGKVAEIEISSKSVEEYYSKYTCRCRAYFYVGGNRVKIDSKKTSIYYAFMFEHFQQVPIDHVVTVGEPTELMCQPPDAHPKPLVIWYKDGVRIDVSKEPRFVLSSINSLMITQTTMADIGNYACEAKNLVDTRRTPPAHLSIIGVSGNWSPWSDWSGCDDSSVPCSQRHEFRTRTCTNPAPRLGGSDCSGRSKTDRPCACPVDGGWSQWSDWSKCDESCRKYRQRTCSSPKPSAGGAKCQGHKLEHSFCTQQECFADDPAVEPKADSSGGSEKQLALYVGLGVALFVLLVIFFLVIFIVRRHSPFIRGLRQRSRHLANGAFGPDEEKKYANFNGIRTINTVGSAGVPATTTDTSLETKLPLLHSSSSSASEASQTSHPFRTMHASSDEYEKLPMTSTYTTFRDPLPDGSSHLVPAGLTVAEHGPLPPTPSSSLSSQQQTDQKSEGSGGSEALYQVSPAPGMYEPNQDIIWAQVDERGARLTLPDSGVSLTLPEGCVPPGAPRSVFIAVSRDDKDRPRLHDAQTQLAPVLVCGPADLLLRKPAVLSFRHCACTRSAQPWVMTVATSDTALEEPPQWQAGAVLGHETLNTRLYCQLEHSSCHLLTERLGRFSLLGESGSPSHAAAVKTVCLAAFTTVASGNTQCVRVYCVEDTADALQGVLESESRLGGRLLDQPKQIPFQDGGASLCFTIEEISEGWRCAQQVQEIAFWHVWRGASDLHCAFWLECSPSKPPLSARLHVYQKKQLAHQQVLHVQLPIHGDPLQRMALNSRGGRATLITQKGVHLSNSEGGLFRLGGEVKRKLCTLLDPPSPRANDWRMLAHALSVDRYINFFATKASPTDCILDLWDTKHTDDQTAINELVSALRSMGRSDCVVLLERTNGVWL